MVEKKKHEMYFEELDLTPEMAADFLELNSNKNRPVSAVLVDRFADDIIHGRWNRTHECLAFDWDGNLLDGQHRLHAVVKAKKVIKIWVAYNCDPSSFDKINVGRARSSADIFTIAFKQKYGESPASNTYVTSIASSMLQGIKSGKPPRDDIWPHAMKHYKLIMTTRQSLGTDKAVNTQVAGAFCNAQLYFGKEAMEPLLNRMKTQMWASTTDPLKILYTRLVKARVKESRDHLLSVTDRYSLTVSAIRACLARLERSKLEGTEHDFGEAEKDKRIKAEIAQVKKATSEIA